MFSLRNKNIYLIIWILFLVRSIWNPCQRKSKLKFLTSSEKWNKLDKAGMESLGKVLISQTIMEMAQLSLCIHSIWFRHSAFIQMALLAEC